MRRLQSSLAAMAMIAAAQTVNAVTTERTGFTTRRRYGYEFEQHEYVFKYPHETGKRKAQWKREVQRGRKG